MVITAGRKKIAIFWYRILGLLKAALAGNLGFLSRESRRLKQDKSPYQFNPYSVSVHLDLLQTIKRLDNVKFTTLLESKNFARNVVVVRHDLDTPECLQNIEYMLEQELELGVRPSILVRADNLDYCVEDYGHLLRRLVAKGGEWGLHSSSYAEDSPEKAFDDEYKRLSDVLGAAPEIYNFHGLGRTRLDVRMKMMASTQSRLDRFSHLEATDSINGYYAYRIMDCHTHKGQRVIRHDYKGVGEKIFSKGRVLVLAHPVYWRAE